MDFNLLKDGKSPSSETLLPVDAREKTATGAQPTTADSRQRPDSTGKMATVRTRTMIMLMCMLALLGVASTRLPCHGRAANHKALEAVRRSDAPLGGSILQLAKREDNSTSEGPSSTPPDSKTETETETEAPTSDPTTEIPPSTTIIPPTSRPTSDEPSSSSSVPPPTSDTPSSTPTPTPTPSSSLPGTSLSTSDSTSSQTSSEPESSSSSAPQTRSSSTPQTRPSSSIPGETTLTTSTKPPSTTNSPRPTSRQTTETFTSTSPNGAVVVITRTNFVPADGGETPAPTSTGAAPSLQNSAVNHRSGASTVAGIVGFAMLLLVV